MKNSVTVLIKALEFFANKVDKPVVIANCGNNII